MSDSDPVLGLMRELAHAPEVTPIPTARPRQGDRIAERFEILREIGACGFGIVFEAIDHELGRSVALKWLLRRTLAEQDNTQLREEARLVANLRHPNIVTLHDLGAHEGRPYLVFELLRGETLARRLTRGPLSVDAAPERGDVPGQFGSRLLEGYEDARLLVFQDAANDERCKVGIQRPSSFAAFLSPAPRRGAPVA